MDPLTYIFHKFNLDSFFGESKHNSWLGFEERFCPNCGSNRVEPYHDFGKNVGALLFNLDGWKCKDCSYTGMMPTRSEEGEDKLDFEPVEQETLDYSYHGLTLRSYQVIVVVLLVAAAYVWLVAPLV